MLCRDLDTAERRLRCDATACVICSAQLPKQLQTAQLGGHLHVKKYACTFSTWHRARDLAPAAFPAEYAGNCYNETDDLPIGRA